MDRERPREGGRYERQADGSIRRIAKDDKPAKTAKGGRAKKES